MPRRSSPDCRAAATSSPRCVASGDTRVSAVARELGTSTARSSAGWPRPASPVRSAAVVSLPAGLFAPGGMFRIADGRVGPDAVADKLARLREWFFENTEREAAAGAQLVAWPEMNFLVSPGTSRRLSSAPGALPRSGGSTSRWGSGACARTRRSPSRTRRCSVGSGHRLGRDAPPPRGPRLGLSADQMRGRRKPLEVLRSETSFALRSETSFALRRRRELREGRRPRPSAKRLAALLEGVHPSRLAHPRPCKRMLMRAEGGRAAADSCQLLSRWGSCPFSQAS